VQLGRPLKIITGLELTTDHFQYARLTYVIRAHDPARSIALQQNAVQGRAAILHDITDVFPQQTSGRAMRPDGRMHPYSSVSAA
jgi:hypothetical protein